jgi:hypothetical protein
MGLEVSVKSMDLNPSNPVTSLIGSLAEVRQYGIGFISGGGAMTPDLKPISPTTFPFCIFTVQPLLCLSPSRRVESSVSEGKGLLLMRIEGKERKGRKNEELFSRSKLYIFNKYYNCRQSLLAVSGRPPQLV